jgi:hypothetical protein
VIIDATLNKKISMDKPASRRLSIPFGSGGRSLAYKLQSFLDLILRLVGEVLHHGRACQVLNIAQFGTDDGSELWGRRGGDSGLYTGTGMRG